MKTIEVEYPLYDIIPDAVAIFEVDEQEAPPIADVDLIRIERYSDGRETSIEAIARLNGVSTTKVESELQNEALRRYQTNDVLH